MDLRKIVRIVAAVFVVVVIIPIGGDYLSDLATDEGFLGNPRLDLLIRQFAALSTWIVSTWWYPWLTGYVIGFGVGVWCDAFARMRDVRRAHERPDNEFDFDHFAGLLKRAKEHVSRDIEDNGLGHQARISMDAANEMLAVMLYLAEFGITTPMRGEYPHMLLQTFLVRSYHYLSLIAPYVASSDLASIRAAKNARLADRESQLLKGVDQALQPTVSPADLAEPKGRSAELPIGWPAKA